MKNSLIIILGSVVLVLIAFTFVTCGGLEEHDNNAFSTKAIELPNLNVCDDITCDNVQDEICSDAGFKITLVSYLPASGAAIGSATYVYEICEPPAGVCVSTVRPGEPCLDNNFCKIKGQQSDPNAYCTRECATDVFRGLSHFDVSFPELGGIGSCLTAENTVSGTCACTTNTSGTCSVSATIVLGDASCFDSPYSVAKCDNTSMGPGDCITMTLQIAGETNGLGSGPIVVVDKEATTCTASCMSGPSCDPCEQEEGTECLTRTIGFWGNHPWITNDFVPVTVCGKTLGCYGASDGMSDPACLAYSCNSVIEGLCSNPGNESPKNQPYVAMVRQLTAAKLNLSATADLFEGGACSTYVYDGKTIQEWIAICEGLCGANKATISGSGCIEALDDFNNSQDTGFEVTPAPFDRPPVDDFGNISGADPTQCNLAQGNKAKDKYVIGMSVGGHDCR